MNHIGSILTDHSSTSIPQGTPPYSSPPSFSMEEPLQQFPPAPPVPPQPVQPIVPQHLPQPPIQEIPLEVDKLKEMIQQMKLQLQLMEQMLDAPSKKVALPSSLGHTPHVYQHTSSLLQETHEPFTEGVFNGTAMVGADGKEYPVSPNYASKSKLVEGDLMKMTEAPNGMLRFKQIGPIGRKHVQGQVMYDTVSKQWSIVASGRVYKVLTAAITFHKAAEGDTATIIVPEDGESSWAAIDHVIK